MPISYDKLRIIILLAKEYPIQLVLLVILILSTISVSWSNIEIKTEIGQIYYWFFAGALISTVIASILIKLQMRKLGILAMSIKRSDMQKYYDYINNKKIKQANDLIYMGTSLKGLFAPAGFPGPRYDFINNLKSNNNLRFMKVLLKNPEVQSQQTAEVEKAQGDWEEQRNLTIDIKKTLNSLGAIIISLSSDVRNKIQVKVCSEILYEEFNMADEKMIATHYCCKGLGNRSPVYYLETEVPHFFWAKLRLTY